MVSWTSKKQDSVSLSTVEAEYINAASNCTQIVWMRQILKDIKVIHDEPSVIYCDNSSAINISKNLVKHLKTKHISIKYNYLREQVSEEKVNLEYVSTKEQIGDVFTKPLPIDTFIYFRDKLGVSTTANDNYMH